MLKIDLTAQGVLLGRSVAGTIPAGAEIVGFSRSDPGDFGALVRLLNGDLVQCCHGVCRPLPPDADGDGREGNDVRKQN